MQIKGLEISDNKMYQPKKAIFRGNLGSSQGSEVSKDAPHSYQSLHLIYEDFAVIDHRKVVQDYHQLHKLFPPRKCIFCEDRLREQKVIHRNS